MCLMTLYYNIIYRQNFNCINLFLLDKCTQIKLKNKQKNLLKLEKNQIQAEAVHIYLKSNF